MSTFLLYFGWPDGAVWSNLLASLICAGVVWWRLRARMVAQHAEVLAQNVMHHREHLAQSETQHQAIMAQAAALHEGLKSHVSAVGSHMASAVAVPQQVLDDIRNAPKSAVVPQKLADVKPEGGQM